jgi:hypothetical protein
MHPALRGKLQDMLGEQIELGTLGGSERRFLLVTITRNVTDMIGERSAN